MDFNRAKEEIKARLPEYAAAVLTRSRGKDQYNCPFCGSGTGAKATGAFTVYPETSRYKCFSCGISGDIFDLAAHVERLEKGDLFKFLAEKYGLQELHKEYCIYKPHTGYKGANEALNADRKVFQSYVLHGMEHINELTAAETDREKTEYLNEITVAAHSEDFLDGVAASVNTEAIATGFPVLDTVLDGGLYEGLYGIGAISSLGKTTFALQIADQIAAAGNNVLIFSLEISRNELIAKSLSRLTAKITIDNHGDIRNAKTTRAL